MVSTMITEVWLIIGALQVALLSGYFLGRARGRAVEQERTRWQIDRLFQEGRLSASLRILKQRLQGNEDYDEPRQSDIARNRISDSQRDARLRAQQEQEDPNAPGVE